LILERAASRLPGPFTATLPGLVVGPARSTIQGATRRRSAGSRCAMPSGAFRASSVAESGVRTARWLI